MKPKWFYSAWTALAVVLLTGAAPARATEVLTFIHTDVAGSPIAATDINGNVIWREGYRPYGARTKNESAAADNRQFFHGKAFDADSGLSYFGARYYDPFIGRFMGVDPQHFDENNLHSFNRYTYGNNNPYKFVDPDGNSPTTVFNLTPIAQAIQNIYGRAQVVIGSAMQTPLGQFAMQSLASEVGAPSVAPITATARALTAADLGIQGTIKQLSGTISLNAKQLNIAVDIIEGRISNIYQIIPHLKETATKLGATELRIHGTVVNESLERALVNRVGATITRGSDKYQDIISIPIHVNKIPD